MQTSAKTLLTGFVFAGAVLGSTVSAADELTGNIALTNNYAWRGLTQTDNQAAIQGGADFAHGSGLYAGVWASNVAFDSSETDLYLGFAGEAGEFGYDIGYIRYVYPEMTEDFGEVYLGGSFKMVSAKIWYDTENENLYGEANLDFDLGNDRSLSLHVGSYDFDDAGTEDYIDYSVSLSKSMGNWDWGVTISDTDLKTGVDEDPKVILSASTSFDL